MDLYGLSGEVEVIQRRLASGLAPKERLNALVTLAWYLRERDTTLSLERIEEAEAILRSGGLAADGALLARITLIRANAAWLFADLDLARTLVSETIAGFDRAGDRNGAGDARLIAAAVALDRGAKTERSALFEVALEDYRAGADPERIAFVEIALVRDGAYRDRAGTAARWAALAPSLETRVEPSIVASRAAHLGSEAYLDGGFDEAIIQYQPGFEAALGGGLLRTAIILGANIASSFDNLKDHATALEWAERALELARAAKWPALIAIPLGEMADSLRGLGRYDAARDALAEVREILRPLNRSEAFIHGTMSLGELSLALGEPERALTWFGEVERLADAAQRRDFEGTSLRGQAAALNALGRIDEALDRANAALKLAGESAVGFDARLVLAQILERRGDPPEAILVPLLEALDMAAKLEGFAIPGEFLSEIARHHAEIGDFRQAYAFEKAAREARGAIQAREASARASAVQIRLQTERANREAAEQKARAETLERANESLSLLARIGQEITATLDEESVFAALERHVGSLVDATTLMIFLLDGTATYLTLRFGREAGVSLPGQRVDLDDPNALSARAARTREVLVSHVGADAPLAPTHMSGTLTSRSLMFAPLIIGDRLLGVLSVQSTKPGAYGEREQAIFRTLGAYGAIALANAAAMTRLRLAEEAVRHNMETFERLAMNDSLTGIGNRRNFLDRAAAEIARARRQRTPLGLIMLDIDHFKRINDGWGHAQGDIVLCRLVEAVNTQIRPQDGFARIGGEEFVVLLTGVSREPLLDAAERLRETIEAMSIEYAGKRIPVTASFGVTMLTDKDTGIDELLARADAGLYRAKESGRNRVCILD